MNVPEMKPITWTLATSMRVNGLRLQPDRQYESLELAAIVKEQDELMRRHDELDRKLVFLRRILLSETNR